MSKSARPNVNKVIDKYILIRIYKQFKRNPLKIFVLKDFFKSMPKYARARYLNTLQALDLIEEVPTIYKYGNKLMTSRTVKGYRLKKQNENA